MASFLSRPRSRPKKIAPQKMAVTRGTRRKEREQGGIWKGVTVWPGLDRAELPSPDGLSFITGHSSKVATRARPRPARPPGTPGSAVRRAGSRWAARRRSRFMLIIMPLSHCRLRLGVLSLVERRHESKTANLNAARGDEEEHRSSTSSYWESQLTLCHGPAVPASLGPESGTASLARH